MSGRYEPGTAVIHAHEEGERCSAHCRRQPSPLGRFLALAARLLRL